MRSTYPFSTGDLPTEISDTLSDFATDITDNKDIQKAVDSLRDRITESFGYLASELTESLTDSFDSYVKRRVDNIIYDLLIGDSDSPIVKKVFGTDFNDREWYEVYAGLYDGTREYVPSGMAVRRKILEANKDFFTTAFQEDLEQIRNTYEKTLKDAKAKLNVAKQDLYNSSVDKRELQHTIDNLLRQIEGMQEDALSGKKPTS